MQVGTRSKHPQPVLGAGGLMPLSIQEAEETSTNGLTPRPQSRPHSTHTRNSSYHGHSDSDDEGGLQMRRVNGSKPAPALSRGASDAQRRKRQLQQDDAISESDSQYHVRHGWAEQLSSEEAAAALSQTFFMYFEDKRHETAGNPPLSFDSAALVCDWRMRDRLKTVSAVLAVCLNVGVDPPDVIKTNPCARLECWVDPIPAEGNSSTSTNNSNASIGKNLQAQYENLAMRTRYKVVLDPTIEELKRYTVNTRKNAHHERTLFHYNGHGVPKPTSSGEVWCFNRSYTQYIPISLFDLQEWVGAPGLWVWDCSASGGIIKGFRDAAEKHKHKEAADRENNRASHHSPSVPWDDSIHLAACKDNEVLPTNPDLPADIFTSCLTTPIAMAVRFFILQNPLKSTSNISLDQARRIPGKVSERRTPLGELNWIFTAITDTIAWNSLDKDLFKKLFRQDLMVAALFRNFLLAQRMMRMYHCHPQSWPEIPDTHNHPLWRSWDLAVEMILNQLPRLTAQQKMLEEMEPSESNGPNPNPSMELDYTHSDFFADQLSAFEVYLQSAPSNASVAGYAKPPEQLPIVLQVLLSQVHRLRALILLSKFLDLGPWAVNLALSIGIFPYVLKLLQSQALELKPPMIFIWARILAVDQSCQSDLVKDAGYGYFTSIINPAVSIPIQNVAEHRAMCAFVIAMFCKDFKAGKEAIMATHPDIIENCLQHLLDMENPLLRQFSCLCLSNLWRDCPQAKARGLEVNAHGRIGDRSHDPIAEVRAAALDALTSFIATGPVNPMAMFEEETLASIVLSMALDGSIMVRRELTVLYSTFIKRYEGKFIVAAWEQLVEERDKKAGRQMSDEADTDSSAQQQQFDGANDGPDRGKTNGINGTRGTHRREVSFSRPETVGSDTSASRPSRILSNKTIYRAIWRQTMIMSADPHPEVARNAAMIMDYIINALLESPLGSYANEALDELVMWEAKKAEGQAPPLATDGLTRQRSKDQGRPMTPPSPAASTMSKAESGYFGLSRTASVAGAMKNLIWGTRTPAESATPPSPSRSHRGSMHAERPYRSRPLTPADAALLPPDALDNIQGPAHQPKAKVPQPPNFVERKSYDLPQLPLKSSFLTWSASYFREPQMRPAESEEPGSIDYNERLWRRNRNDRIIASTQPLKEAAGSQRWDTPCGYFGIGAAPAKMVLHQFEDHIVTSDDRDSIAVWDWRESRQLCRFSNGNPRGSRVTELRFINEDDNAMLMTGSSDGVIRIFKNYDQPKKIQLASSFRALNDLVVSDRGNAGLVFDWQQGQGRCLVAGDERVIRVWQAGHELCVSDIPARSSSCITSLTSDQVEGNVFVAGFGNGSVRAYDQRLSPRDSMIMDWVDRRTDHRSWIVGVHLQRGGLRELISAESNGGIRLWDIRMRRAVAGLDGKPHNPRNLRSLSVHEHAPVFATGGADHTIRVYNTSLQHLSSSEPYMSYLRTAVRNASAPITATAFHPHRMMLACGAVNDGHVNLFRCDAQAPAAAGVGGDGVVEEWKG